MCEKLYEMDNNTVTKAKMRKSATPERILKVKLVRGTILCCWGSKNLIYTFLYCVELWQFWWEGLHTNTNFKNIKFGENSFFIRIQSPNLNLLKSPGIDSQPGRPVVYNPINRRSYPPSYICWRNRFLGIDSWAP